MSRFAMILVCGEMGSILGALALTTIISISFLPPDAYSTLFGHHEPKSGGWGHNFGIGLIARSPAPLMGAGFRVGVTGFRAVLGGLSR
jgi:hypothetical protein